MKEMMENVEKRKKYQIQVYNHTQSVSRYQSYANQYKEKLKFMDKQSLDYKKYEKIYKNNLKNEYTELVKSAEKLQKREVLLLRINLVLGLLILGLTAMARAA